MVKFWPFEKTNPARTYSDGVFRDSAGIRTQDPQLRRLLLYPAELPNHPCFAVAKLGDYFKISNHFPPFFPCEEGLWAAESSI